MTNPQNGPETWERIASAYKRVFSGPDGKVVLENLKRVHGVLGPLLEPNEPMAPEKLFWREGERNVVLRILTILNEKDI